MRLWWGSKLDCGFWKEVAADNMRRAFLFTVYCSPNALRSALGALPHLVTAQSQVLRAWILHFSTPTRAFTP